MASVSASIAPDTSLEGHHDVEPARPLRPVLPTIQTDVVGEAQQQLRPPSSPLAIPSGPSGRGRGLKSSSSTQGRQWSLFEQRMENEGQIGSFGSSSLLRSTPKRPTRQELMTPVSHSMASEEVAFSPLYSAEPDEQEQDRPNVQQRAQPSNLSQVSEYDSEDSESTIVQLQQGKRVFPSLPTLPVLSRNILKCCVAYFVASLFTFVPALAGLISDLTANGAGERYPSPAGHMVATVAVYFNPAKTRGAMFEADLFCLLGLVWSAFITLGSMSSFWWLELKPGWEWLADVMVLAWVGLGMTAVAWLKVWMNKPSLGPACSLTAIILFVVVVKEGGLETLLQVSFIVLIGSVISNLVCHFMWPQSAVTILQANITRTLDSYATLLSLLTDTFLLQDSSSLHQPSQGKLQRAIENHQTSFTTLKKNLIEAQSEWLFGGPSIQIYSGTCNASQAYDDAVGSLNRLAQHLNGLRSSTKLQTDLAKALRDGKITLKRKHFPPGVELGTTRYSDDHPNMEEEATLKAAAAMFGELVDDLDGPLTALSGSCNTTLKRLRNVVVPQNYSEENALEPAELYQLIDDIERALYTFESTSNHSLMRAYRSSNWEESVASMSAIDQDADQDVYLQSRDSESVFLVYHFIFTMEEFARELVLLVDAMSRVYLIERAAAQQNAWWYWLTFFPLEWFSKARSCRGNRLREKKSTALRRRLSLLFTNPRRNPPVFPKVRPHAPNTVQTPARSNLSLVGRMKQTLWAIGSKLKDRTVMYAFKAGMATAILAAPAFIGPTRPMFVEYKGEWALISYFVVISPTIGATNYLSLHRVLGTLIGAITAAVMFGAFPENAALLSIFGFFFSIPCFYYIVARPEYASGGRFLLLTYNLTCLYCYNIRQSDVSVWDIAVYRFLSVAIGVVWAGLVARFWWPAEARRELGNALSEFCTNIGWLYTRLVVANSAGSETFVNSINLGGTGSNANGEGTDGQHSALLGRQENPRLRESVRAFMAMELHLQIKLIELQGLLAQTQHEPRLKGPFPVKLYRNILTSLQTILDKLHSMRCVTTREEWVTTVQQDFIVPVNKERRDMVGNVILYFSVLSSAFKLKAPLPPYLPPAEKSRQRLVEAIRRLEVVKNREVKGSRHLLFFAYALTMQGVCQELDYLGNTLQQAFGVIGQTIEEFDALFPIHEERTNQLA